MYKFIFFLLGSCLFWSCESMINDLDEDKLPKVESKLAVECYISPQSDEIRVIVTESQPLFGPSSYTPIFIKNAIITLSGEQGEIQIPYYDSTSYQISRDKFPIEAGKKYILVVTDGRRTVKASCVVPSKTVQLKSYKIDSVFSYHYEGDTVARVKIAWNDIPGESNYYTIRGYAAMETTTLAYDTESGWSKPQRVLSKTLLDYRYMDYLISDTNLDGITFEAPTYYVQLPRKYNYEYIDRQGNKYTVYSDPKFSEVQFEVLNLDVNYYRFYKSLKENRNGDNPFVEPALMYSNIEGGLGCFGAYNNAIFKVKP